MTLTIVLLDIHIGPLSGKEIVTFVFICPGLEQRGEELLKQLLRARDWKVPYWTLERGQEDEEERSNLNEEQHNQVPKLSKEEISMKRWNCGIQLHFQM